MEKSEVLKKILEWEQDAGESFVDYFCHDTIKDSSWAFFLLGKGLKGHATVIINEILDDNECIGQDVLYEIKPEYSEDTPHVFNKENFEYNMSVVAEFIACTEYYVNQFVTFLKEQ